MDCPSRVGCGALAGRTKSGLESAALNDFDLEFFALGRVLRGPGVAFVPVLVLSNAPVTTLFELAAGGGSDGRATSSFGLFAATVCASRAPLFAAVSVGLESSGGVLSARLALAVRTGSAPKELPYSSMINCGGLFDSAAV